VSEPFRLYRSSVRPEWIDYNGHLTDWAYAVVCSEANELVLDHLGVGAAYRERTGCAAYTVEAHLSFLGEVGPDGELQAESVLLSADAKRLRVRTTLLDRAGRVVLTAEHLYVHVDTRSGRVVPFPRGGPYGGVMDDQDILAKVSRLVDEEHRLRSGEVDDDARRRLAQLEEQLDQCWDLLRQRQAKREYGEPAAGAQERPASEVEGYLQ
jgi:acyl-CoA thioesterase FadM